MMSGPIARRVHLDGEQGRSGARPEAGLDALMQAYVGAVPGAAVLLLQDGEPVVRRGYGLAELEQGAPVTPATNFRLASVTKQFTAAAILLLAEDGSLGLDDAALQWLPTLQPAADTVTIRQLLTHTSGLVDYEDVIPASMTEQLHDADVLALLRDRGPHELPTGHRVSLQQQRLRAARPHRRARLRSIVRRVPAGAHLQAARHGGNRRAPGRHLHGRPPGIRLQRRERSRGSVRTRARRARSSATAAFTRRSTTWRNGMPRSRRPAARCGIAPAGVLAGDAHGRPFGRIRLRLANHGGFRLAFRRDRGVPQRHRPLPGAPADDRHPHEPGHRRALPGGTRHCGTRPACRTNRKHQVNQHVTSAPEPPRMPRIRAVSAGKSCLDRPNTGFLQSRAFSGPAPIDRAGWI